MLVFSKGGGGKRKREWSWKDKVIEEVRDFNYLGITLTKCGSLKGLLKERLKKANVVMRQVWGIAEKKFKDDFKRRMMMFYSLVLGVMMYGIELIGWKESDEMERIQLKYIKWTLGFLYLYREKIRVKTGRRAIKFEEGVRTSTDRLILKQCLKEKDRNIVSKEREEYLRRNGYSQQGIVKL